MTSKDGVLKGLKKNKIWLEMSTTDQSEVKRIGLMVKKKGSYSLDVPVIIILKLLFIHMNARELRG